MRKISENIPTPKWYNAVYEKKMNKQSYKPFGEQMKSDNIRQMNNDKYFSYLKNSI